MLRKNDRPVAKQSHRSHGMIEFAQIAAPFMMNKFLHSFRVDRSNRFTLFVSCDLQLGGNQRRQLLKPIAAWGNEQGQTVEPLIQVFREFALPDTLLK